MQSSMLITYNDCTYSWATLLERGAVPHFPALWGRRAGGRWMALLIGHSFYQSDASNETTAHNGGCQSENVGEQRGISLSNIPSAFVFASVFEFTAVRQGERLVSVNEGLSPRHRIHSTTYTGGGSVQVTHQKTHTNYIKSWSKLQACMSYSCFMTSQRWKVSRFSKSTSQFHLFFILHPAASLQLRTTKCVFLNGFLIFIVVDYFN